MADAELPAVPGDDDRGRAPSSWRGYRVMDTSSGSSCFSCDKSCTRLSLFGRIRQGQRGLRCALVSGKREALTYGPYRGCPDRVEPLADPTRPSSAVHARQKGRHEIPTARRAARVGRIGGGAVPVLATSGRGNGLLGLRHEGLPAGVRGHRPGASVTVPQVLGADATTTRRARAASRIGPSSSRILRCVGSERARARTVDARQDPCCRDQVPAAGIGESGGEALLSGPAGR